ncbi:hypothetical protein CKO42_02610 [Lamprobacter modestohalophilus]|uniref:TNase-like domain-containing protein n=1 Tax=Lamprobacter modestohalophilus TaxID=1064514 RepID=A0A9X0W5T5_9GAMM|nr:hypothetical protein [Lamprobacter modestohalophilus]MBK1617362.1 hypothetical protein [Lamprobacter modestohalophilus]
MFAAIRAEVNGWARSLKRWRRPRRLLLVMVLALPLIGLLRQWLCYIEVEGEISALSSAQLLQVGEARVRLNEVVITNQPASAREARRYLQAQLLGQSVRCRGCRRGESTVISGWCELPDGTRVERLLVEAGFARDCPAASGGQHAAFETAAAESIPLPDRCRPWMRRGPRPPIR